MEEKKEKIVNYFKSIIDLITKEELLMIVFDDLKHIEFAVKACEIAYSPDGDDEDE